MKIPKIFESEYRLCKILWKNEPIKSRDLATLCEEQLGWKKTTTYTVIKRLSERGILKNENTVVTSLIKEREVQASEIDELVTNKFNGSIPAFISTFVNNHKLSESEIAALQLLIDKSRS